MITSGMKKRDAPDGTDMGRRHFLKAALALFGIAGAGLARLSHPSSEPAGSTVQDRRLSSHPARYYARNDELAG